MHMRVIVVVGCVVGAIYVALRLLLKLTQHAKEPPAILTGIPFLGPLPGMLREKSNFYLRLRFAQCRRLFWCVRAADRCH
jgi:hypothetical protein